MSRELQLTRGLVAIVDGDDWDIVMAYRWHVTPALSRTGRQCNWYASRGGRLGEPSTVYLHRHLLGAEPGWLVDHINGDGLDCRRSNLRLCTPSQNNANRRERVASSGFRGVHPKGPSWRAQIQVGDRRISSRVFADPADAARAYDELALEHFGEFAALNFPSPTSQDERA